MDFHGAQFEELAYFLGSQLQSAYFIKSQFLGKTTFSGAKFKEHAEFSNARFKEIDFAGAQSHSAVIFSGAQFQGRVIFSEEQFSGGKADFHEARFQTEIDFSKKQFPLGANFHRAQFEKANFSETEFQGNLTDFSEVQFQGQADFSSVVFKAGANFLEAKFKEQVSFYNARFEGESNFIHATFYEEAVFVQVNYLKANLKGEANFYGSDFHGKARFSGEFDVEIKFNNVFFEGKEKVVFDTDNLSNFSFMDTDVTGVRFSNKAIWGKNVKDKFKTIEERKLEDIIKDKNSTKTEVSLGGIKAVYRALRENYEYRMRYDEAGQFFVREMELKRMYREVPSISNFKLKIIALKKKIGKDKNPPPDVTYKIKQNNWFRRNLFSLTGWYYHLSRYGEDLLRPTLAGVAIVALSTLFWLMQSNPTIEPSFSQNNPSSSNVSNFIGLSNFTNPNHLQKSFERSIADFIPLLPLGSNIKVGVIDYIIKIVGGAVTFALIAVALRRRFERRFRH